jgi:AAA ATPase domain
VQHSDLNIFAPSIRWGLCSSYEFTMSSHGESSLEEMRRASMQRNALFKASLGFLATPFEAEAARSFAVEPSSAQTHVAAVERHPGLDGVNPDARLNARWPCREQQIEALAETIGSVYEHCSPIVVHGPSGTGKTSIVRDVMEESGCPYTFIDCKRLQNQRMLLQAILEQLTLCKRLRPSSKVQRSTRHCIWSSGKLKAAQSKKVARPRSASTEVVDVSGATSGTGSRKRSASNSVGSSTKSAGSCAGSIADTDIDDAALDELDEHNADALNDDVDADLDNQHKFFVEEQQQQQSVPVQTSRVYRAASIDTVVADDTANGTASHMNAAPTEHVNSARATSGWQTFAAVLNTFLTSAAAHGNHDASAPLKLYMVFDR